MKKLSHGLVLFGSLSLAPLALAQQGQSTTDSGRTTSPGAQDKSDAQGKRSESRSQCCGMMGGEGGMMHGGEGGSMGHMMGGMGGSSMMGSEGMCGQMGGMADVKVEQTRDGAVLRLTARSPENVQQVQQHAQMMQRCMSGMGVHGDDQHKAQPSPPSGQSQGK